MKPKLPVRIGLAITTLVYLLYSSLGIAAPFWWGHHGYHGATYMLRARMTLRFHMLAPATYTGYDYPPQNALYFHHPVGYHHLLSILVPIFGEHEWLARGLAVVGGLFALWALYALVSASWSREMGLVACIVYVCLPVVTSFSVLSDPMLIALACVCWSLWAYLQFLEKPSARLLIHAAAAYAIGGIMMWEAYFIAPFIAIHSIAYAYTRRGRTLRLTVGGRAWSAPWLHVLATGAACTAMMAFHIWFTWHANAWPEFLESYRIRHSPPSAPYVIERHTQWVDLLYGPVPVFVGAVWFIVWLARVATNRTRLRDIAVLTFLYVNTLYIYMFAEGSSVHLYRVFFYSGFFALAVTDLVDDAYHAARRLAGGARASRAIPIAAAVATLAAYLAAEVPHAYRNLVDSRALMGTHGQTNYNPEQEKMLFAAEMTRITRPDERVIVHYGHLGARKEFWYYLDRGFDEITVLQGMDRFKATWKKSLLILDEHSLTPSERPLFESLMQHHPVTFYDRYAMVDLRSDKPLVRGYAFQTYAMSRRYRWLVSHRFPPMRLIRRGYEPGTCTAANLGVPVATDEEAAPWPEDPRRLPCYHNYLVARGDARGAGAVEAAIAKGLVPVGAYLGGARVVAAGPAAGKLRVVLDAAGPEGGDLVYHVERTDLPPDAPNAAWDQPASPSLPPPSAWRTGQLYIDEVAAPPPGTRVTIRLQKPPPPAPPSAPPGRWHLRLPPPKPTPPHVLAELPLP